MAYDLSTQDVDVVHRATNLGQSMVGTFLSRQNAELRAKIIAASHIAIVLNRNDELRDPYEDDPVWAEKVREAQRAAGTEVKAEGMGRCHLIWERQAEILWKTYQIRWYSPAKMNPWISFD